GHLSEAQQDISQYFQMDPKDPYGAMWLYLARAKAGTDGKSELKTNTAALDLSKWPGPGIQLYLDQSTPENVLRAAGNELLVVGCIVVLAPLLGLGKADFSFARGINFMMQAGVPASRLRYPLLLIGTWLIGVFFAVPINFGEEFGWRSYLQLRLFPDGPVLSAVVTGVIWAAWHYPLTLRGFNYPDHPLAGSL